MSRIIVGIDVALSNRKPTVFMVYYVDWQDFLKPTRVYTPNIASFIRAVKSTYDSYKPSVLVQEKRFPSDLIVEYLWNLSIPIKSIDLGRKEKDQVLQKLRSDVLSRKVKLLCEPEDELAAALAYREGKEVTVWSKDGF